VNAVLPQGDWRKWEVTRCTSGIVTMMGTLIDFVVVAFVVFLVMVKAIGAAHRKMVPLAARHEALPRVSRERPLAARRCRACTSVFAVGT